MGAEVIEAQQLFTTKSVNLTTPKSARFAKSSSPKKNKHARNVSVGNLVPNKYLKHAPSLIALLDKQHGHALQLNAFRPSKSMPDFRGRNGSNSSNSISEDYTSPITKSEDNIFSNEAIPDSEDNVMMMIINDENEQSVILNNDVDGAEKRIEYEQFIPINNDEIVDMQTLALKAAQEFATLANENDNLFKENETLKARFDDILHDKTKLTEQLAKYQNNNSINSQIIDDIDSLKSEQLKWKMEKKLLMEQLEESNKQIHGQLSDDRLMGKTAPKLKNDTSEDSNRLMMESLAKITREKNALLQTLENEKNMKREYEKMIANLNKSLTENERDRRLLSQNLNKQQALYQSLKQNAKKKEAEIDDIVGRTRTLTVEQEEQEKKQLLEAVDEQKAYIQQLEAENQQLMNAKIKDDDLMFSELKQLKTHRFARSQLDGTFDGIAGIASLSEHQRGPSHSMSNYSTSGLNIFNHLNAPLYPQSVRQINLSALDQEYSDEFEEDEMQQQQVYEATPSPKKSAKKVNFS